MSGYSCVSHCCNHGLRSPFATLGNIPQAFSHIGIINTALNLHRARCPVLDRAQVADRESG
ncbi:hypothetical protein EJA05_10470 [Pseudomonas oryziphila]|uniref:Uncharacterized protein n=1 Tax=Pseudomonas entomophila TaxID=312306 RepID=A0A3S8UIT3_9PSED|nr:hypothetical protein EJA05_10470 [Pseudomonas oryziphila]